MPDPYADPDAQAHSAVQAMMIRLEERGRHPAFQRMIQAYSRTLPTDRPLRLLDLGCGTGVVLRHLATVLHPLSILHGADVSAGLLSEAKRLAPALTVTWDHLKAGPLPYPDATFDAITMHTLLSHVSDPAQVLREAKRVLKQTGRLIVFDADHAGTTYNQAEYTTTRRIDQIIAAAITTQPDICRQIPRLLKSCGYTLTHHDSDVISECGKGDYWLSSVRGLARLMPAIGALSAPETEAWSSYLMRSHENGTFFAAGTFYTFYIKPME